MTKRTKFAAEYVVDQNATQAAIRAGYSEHTAYSQGSRLLKVVFDRFKSVCNAKLNVSQRIEISMQNEKSQAMSLFAYLGRGQHLELGSMAHILRLCNGRTAQKELLIGTLRNFITRDLGGDTLLDKDNVDCIALISKDFRNRAVHSDVITQAQADECRQLCMNVLQSIEPCVAEYAKVSGT